MNTQLMTTTAPLPPSVIGWNYQGRVVGFRELGRVTWNGIFKASAATVVAAGATAVRGAHLAIAEIETTRGQLKGQAETYKRQRDEAVNRAAYVEELLHQAKASRKAPRWTDAERAFLAGELAQRDAKRPGYQAIATLMTETFGRKFTAATIGTHARALRAAEPVKATSATVAKPKAAAPATKARKRRAK